MYPVSIESFHAVLFCRKWDACVSFYRDVLGFETVDARQGFIEVQVTPESRIGLIRHAEEKRNDSFLLTFRVVDLDGIHAFLSERCSSVSEIKRHSWGADLFELRDPEGRRLEFWRLL